MDDACGVVYGGRRGRKKDPLSELFFRQVCKLVQSKRHIPLCVQNIQNFDRSIREKYVGPPFFVEDVELLNFSLVGEKHFFSTAGCSFDDTPAACVKNRPI